MKKILLCLLLGTTFLQCTTDQENETTAENENLAYEQGLNLSTQAPNPSLDATNEGLYKGSALTNDLSFHERINININNDGHINAQILVNKTDNASHYLKGSVLNAANNTYAFTGSMGSFTLQLNKGEAVIYDAIFDNKQAVASVFKSTSTRLLENCTLGSFINSGTAIGAWDIMWSEVSNDEYTGTAIMLTTGGNTYNLSNSERLRYIRTCDGNGNARVRSLQVEAISGSDGVMFLGRPINFTYNSGVQEIGTGGCNNGFPDPENLEETQNEWSWINQSGILASGTIILDTSTLPIF